MSPLAANMLHPKSECLGSTSLLPAEVDFRKQQWWLRWLSSSHPQEIPRLSSQFQRWPWPAVTASICGVNQGNGNSLSVQHSSVTGSAIWRDPCSTWRVMWLILEPHSMVGVSTLSTFLSAGVQQFKVKIQHLLTTEMNVGRGWEWTNPFPCQNVKYFNEDSRESVTTIKTFNFWYTEHILPLIIQWLKGS